MRKLVYSAALLLSLSGCSSVVDNDKIDSFLTDLSQVYVYDFKGPNPEETTKIDFAVRRLAIDSPDMFESKGHFMIIDADKVHAKSDEYFNYPIEEDQSTNEVDYTKDGRYQILASNENQFVFSKAKILKERHDTLLLDVDIYACNTGWKGSVNSNPEDWETIDPDNIPQKSKTMRTVLVKKGDSFRIISYMNSQSGN